MSQPELGRQLSQQRGDIDGLYEIVERLEGKVDSGFAELRAEIGAVRTNVSAEIGTVRTDLSSEIGTVRNDVNAVRTQLDAVLELLRRP